MFSDSFFAPDSRYDAFGGESMQAPLPPVEPRARGYRPRAGAPDAPGFRDSQLRDPHARDSQLRDSQFRDSQFSRDFPTLPSELPEPDIGGVVVDSPRYGRR